MALKFEFSIFDWPNVYNSGAMVTIVSIWARLSLAIKSFKIVDNLMVFISTLVFESPSPMISPEKVGKLRYSPQTRDIMPKTGKAARGKHRWIGLELVSSNSEREMAIKKIESLLNKSNMKLYDFINENKRKSCIIKIKLKGVVFSSISMVQVCIKLFFRISLLGSARGI